MAREVTRSVPSATPWNDDFQRIVRTFFGDADATLAGAFSPALDVEESDEGFTLHVELPGIAADKVEVSLEDSVLTIAGEREFYDSKSTDAFRRVERRFGRFHRAIRLPDRVDPDKVEAAYKDGLLTITVPKAESAKPRRIQVTAN
jgi:HSP20 family protein